MVAYWLMTWAWARPLKTHYAVRWRELHRIFSSGVELFAFEVMCLALTALDFGPSSLPTVDFSVRGDHPRPC